MNNVSRTPKEIFTILEARSRPELDLNSPLENKNPFTLVIASKENDEFFKVEPFAGMIISSLYTFGFKTTLSATMFIRPPLVESLESPAVL